MKLSLTFQNEQARLTVTAENDYEKRLLGVFAAGEARAAEAIVECKSDSHYSYGKVDSAAITLSRANRE